MHLVALGSPTFSLLVCRHLKRVLFLVTIYHFKLVVYKPFFKSSHPSILYILQSELKQMTIIKIFNPLELQLICNCQILAT
jgi:hypothetical protein